MLALAQDELLMFDPDRNYDYVRQKSVLLSPTRARHELLTQTAQGPYRVDVECEDHEAMNAMQVTANEVIKNLGEPT
jgi:hypothetical protein